MDIFDLTPGPDEIKAAQPMVDWINSAPPGDLAAELMGAFPQVSPSGEPQLIMMDLIQWMLRIRTSLPTYYPVRQAIREGLQLLEHCELVLYLPKLDTENPYSAWTATRLGLTTLAEGKEAVRHRIRERTGC